MAEFKDGILALKIAALFGKTVNDIFELEPED